jgi:hypothetical protein
VRAFALAPIRLVGAFHRAPGVGRSVLVRQAVTLAGVGGTVKRKAWDGTRNPLRQPGSLCYFSERAEQLEMRVITGFSSGCRELLGWCSEGGSGIPRRASRYPQMWISVCVSLGRARPSFSWGYVGVHQWVPPESLGPTEVRYLPCGEAVGLLPTQGPPGDARIGQHLCSQRWLC